MSLGMKRVDEEIGLRNPSFSSAKEKKETATAGAAVQRQMANYMKEVAESKCKRAFSTLFAFYAPKIKQYMLKMGANSGSADELTQECFMTVWAKAHLYSSDKAAVSTWLFRIARNKYIDEVRRTRRSQLNSILYAADQVEDVAVEPSYEVDQSLLSVGKALNLLPKQQYDVVFRMYMKGQTQEEIASEIDVPVGTVKSRARLAYKKLRREIEVEC